MRRGRDHNLKLLATALLIFAFVSSLLSYMSSVQAFNGEGTLFVVEIEANQANRKGLIEKAIKVLEARLKELRAKGEVAKSKDRDDRIVVKVYGTHDIEKLRGLFRNHHLEMRAVVSPPYPNPYKTFSSFADAQKNVRGGQVVRPYNERDGEVKRFVILEGDTIINGKDIRKAEAASRTDFDDDHQIMFSLTPDGASALSEWTEKNINKYIAVLLDDIVVSIPYIKSQISDGEGEISGRFTKAEADAIASSLQSGILLGTLRIIVESRFE